VGATVTVRDARTRKALATWEAHKNPVKTMAASADGRFLTTSDENCQTRLWEAATGKLVRAPKLDSARDSNRFMQVWDGDSVCRVLRIDGGVLSLVDGTKGQLLREFREGSVTAACFAPDGLSFVAAT